MNFTKESNLTQTGTETSSVKVAVRVRPFNRREKKKKSQCVIQVNRNMIQLLDAESQSTTAHTFTYDYSFNSIDSKHPDFADQKIIFEHIGKPIVENALQGYNCTIMAYGQTGSGKSYTVIGGESELDQGLIRRILKYLFEQVESAPGQYQVEVSFLEIYAERVKDLIVPDNTKNLQVREHPTFGPFVESLSMMPIQQVEHAVNYLANGTQYRITAPTKMNKQSSRSHAIFTIYLTGTDPVTQNTTVSKIHLVDLAGSERVKASGVKGIHLKEAANINKSLTTLGRVISTLSSLAEKPTATVKSPPTSPTATSNTHFVPFRDSTLTWILRDSLGGNSKTYMIANVSPAHINYDETLNTLNYAARAKKIVNKVSVWTEIKTAQMNSVADMLHRWSLENTFSSLLHDNRLDMDKIQEITLQQQDTWANLDILNQKAQQQAAETKARFLELKQKVKNMRQHSAEYDIHRPMLINLSPQPNFDHDAAIFIQPGENSGDQMKPKLPGTIVYQDTQCSIIPQFPFGQLLVNGKIVRQPLLLQHEDMITYNQFVFKFHNLK